jgi:fumarate hydratase, class I
MEAQVHKLTQQFGIGAQFGGKYFCHDVRVIRLPRHGASSPWPRRVLLGRSPGQGQDHRDGVFLEELETAPGAVPARDHRRRPRRRGRADRPHRPMSEILGELTRTR